VDAIGERTRARNPNAGAPGAGVLCLDAATGKQIWKTGSPHGDIRSAVTVVNNVVYVVTGESWVAAYDAKTGRPLWKKPMHPGYQAGRPLAINNTPPVPTRHGLLVSDWQKPQRLLDYATGKELSQLPGDVGYYASFATVFDDIMYTVRRGGGNAIHLPDRKEIYKFEEPSRSTSAPIVVDGKLIYSGSSGIRVRDALTGKLIWQKGTANAGYQNAIPVVWGDQVLVNGTNLQIFDIDTGQIRKTVKCAQEADRFLRSRRQAIAGSSTPIVAGKHAFFGHDDTSIRAINRAGDVVWEHRLGTPIKTAPAISGNKLFVHDYAGNLWCFASSTFESHVQMPSRGICAHRGASETHPENTLSALHEAVRLGAQMIEFDIALTKDGQLVLMHDNTIDRTTNGKGRVSDWTLAELKKLDAGSWKNAKFKGERVPTLDEALAIMPENIWLNVHLKGQVELAEKVTKRIVANKRIHQSFLACGIKAAEAAKRIDSRIKICNMERQGNSLKYVKESIAMDADFIQLYGGKSVDPAHTKLLTQNGIRINFCCANDEHFVRRLFEAGTEFPLVDRLEAMLQVAKEIGIERLKPVYRLAPKRRITHGPFVGHVTADSVLVWARCPQPGKYVLSARSDTGAKVQTEVQSSAEHDGCVVWRLQSLRPATRYQYAIEFAGKKLIQGDKYFFTTAPTQRLDTVRLAFASCAKEDEGSAAVWRQMREADPHAVVLLGDTPYIDSTDLAIQRRRYGEFAAVSDFKELVRNRSLYSTWDDHDFGRNDTDGNLKGKEKSRRAFKEYRVNPSYGDGKAGIYTKFRRGGVEVFLLDTRYFAATQPSPFDKDRSTLLGAQQWKWLRRELKASTAAFKVLACGMIWNGAVRPGKKDHWGTYPVGSKNSADR
jgi:glycerophosphoryl diester phosphodiesterase